MTATEFEKQVLFNKKLYKKWFVTLCIEIGWFIWAFLDRDARFGRFTEATPYVGYYYYMSITMVFGSIIAGATPAGGGAVAFPVMVLALGVPPHIGRDFSLGIQSFGMSAASAIIFLLKVPLDYEALIWGSAGGTVGLVVGMVGVAPFLLPPYTKMFFVSLWLSFSAALYLLNRDLNRKVFLTAKESDIAFIQERSAALNEEKDSLLRQAKRKRLAILIGIGLFGGICTSLSGSGLDMATFSILTLYFRESEKVATPTSVVMMAINAVVGICCRFLRLGGAYAPGEELALWKFVSVCIPVVVIGAPLGAFVPIILKRHQIAYCLYILSFVQFVTACVVVQPWSKPAPHGVALCVASAITFVGGSFLFYMVAKLGNDRELKRPAKIISSTDADEEEQAVDEENETSVSVPKTFIATN